MTQVINKWTTVVIRKRSSLNRRWCQREGIGFPRQAVLDKSSPKQTALLSMQRLSAFSTCTLKTTRSSSCYRGRVGRAREGTHLLFVDSWWWWWRWWWEGRRGGGGGREGRRGRDGDVLSQEEGFLSVLFLYVDGLVIKIGGGVVLLCSIF